MIIILLLLCIAHTLSAQEQPALEDQHISTFIIDRYIKNNNSTQFMDDCVTNQALRQFLYDIHSNDETVRKIAREHLHTLIYNLKALHKNNAMNMNTICINAQKEYGNYGLVNFFVCIMLLCNEEIIHEIIPSFNKHYIRYCAGISGLVSLVYAFEYLHKRNNLLTMNNAQIETEKILQFLYNYDATYFE